MSDVRDNNPKAFLEDCAILANATQSIFIKIGRAGFDNLLTFVPQYYNRAH
jgi:hypothetical protein